MILFSNQNWTIEKQSKKELKIYSSFKDKFETVHFCYLENRNGKKILSFDTLPTKYIQEIALKIAIKNIDKL